MKYIIKIKDFKLSEKLNKTYETLKKRFKTGDLVTPLITTKYTSPNKAYLITGESSPIYCRTILKYNGWAYGLETDDEYDTTDFKDSDLRFSTPEEIEQFKLQKDINKFNL